MSTTFKNLICILLVALASSDWLEAQVIPGRWEKLEATSVGTEIIVRLQSGSNVQGRFQRAGADEIAVVANGATIQVAKSDVREITTPMSRDNLKNGALIGGGIGVGVALGLLAIAASGDGYVLESAKWAAPLAGFGVGTAVGIALDAGRNQGAVLYRAR